MAEGRLNLRLMDPADRAPSYDVVVRVEGLGVEGGDRPPRDLVVPARREGGADVDLDPGFYCVRLFLPSGRVLQQTCEVEERGTASVVFHAPPAVDGSFSLQEAVGKASLSELLDSAVLARRAGTADDRNEKMDAAAPPAGRSSRRYFRGGASAERSGTFARRERVTGIRPSAVSRSVVSPPMAEGSAELRLASPEAFKGELGWRVLSAVPDVWAFEPQWTRVSADEERETASIWRIDLPHSDRTRAWAIVRTPKAMELVSLPTPWRCVATGELSPVDVLVDTTLGGRAVSTVAVHDAALDGLLSYLDRGTLTALRPMMEDLGRGGLVTDMIYFKMINPLAACAAGYVGLAIFDGGERAQWDDWLANVMRRFEWLPDGGILHARRIMLRPKSPAERADVIPALKKSIAAGVPYFSAGLQLLREMLEALLGEEPEAEDLLKLVQPVVARSDPRQLFTILRYPGANV